MNKEELENKQRIFVIAEIANAHQGSMTQAKELVVAAAGTGVDAVKFQKFTASELCVKRHPRYQHFKNIELLDEHVRELRRLACQHRIQFFCDAFGTESAQFLMSMPVDGIKVHSSDLSNISMLNKLAKWNRTLLLSCGGSSELEIHNALSVLKPSTAPIMLLHGFQGFPTPIEETHLNRIRYLSDTFHLPVGYMDHVDADDKMAIILPLLSIDAGAVLIEKHMTLSRALKGIDYYSSLNPQEMTDFVTAIRALESAMGSAQNVFGPEEKKYRKNMKKHLVASHNISTGTELKDTDGCFKRTDDDCYSLTNDAIIGKQAIREIKEEETIRLKDLSVKIGILIIARMGSTRLLGKALQPINNRPALSYLIERAKLSKRADIIVLCTTTNVEDDALVDLAVQKGIQYYRGNERNVLKRMIDACKNFDIDVAVRVTGDDILLSYEHLDLAVDQLMSTNSDYCHNKALPGGSECEVFTLRAFEVIHRFAEEPENTEYLTYFIQNVNFNKTELDIPAELKRNFNLTLDTQEDLETLQFLLENIYSDKEPFTQEQLTEFIDRHPKRFKKCINRENGYVAKIAPDCRLNFRLNDKK